MEPDTLTLNTIYNFYLFKSQQRPCLEFLLGIMSSNAGKWYWRSGFHDYKGTFPKIKKDAILAIPVPDWRAGQAAKNYEAIRLAVEQIIKLSRKTAPGGADRTTHAQLKGALGQLNKLVYNAFGLTDQEIATIEGQDS